MHILVIGASGRVGRFLIQEGLRRGHSFTAQTRTPGKLPEAQGLGVVVGSPTDQAFLDGIVPGHDAVVFVLGIDHRRPTTLFSDATRALLGAMTRAGVRRLVAVTGIGSGETRGHGGWFYNWFTFPLFTRNRYADKDRQEALIEASGLDWTIVRPSPFSDAQPRGTLQVFDPVPPRLQLTQVHPREVAVFVIEEVEKGRHLRRKPFIGH
jgi:putative NADH-flavin reductase